MTTCARHAIWATAIWMLCATPVLLADPATAKADPAAPHKAATSTTWHEYRDAVLAFNRESMSGAYKKVGTHGAWDADAIAFLDRMAMYFSTARMNWVYHPADGVPSHDELLAAGKKLLDAGCTDPLVTYCYAAALHDSGKPEDALPLLERALDGLQKAGYPNNRIAPAAARIGQIDHSPEAADRSRQIIFEQRLLACSGKLSDIARREMCKLTWNELSTFPREKQLAFITALGNRPDADPWVLNVLDGEIHIGLAWESRGGGWANTVTEDGWKGFFDHLSRARFSLVAAYKLAPQLPESSINMIPVAMGAGDRLVESTSTWFDRAFAAQIDNFDAYSQIYNALLPRWGGDYGAIYDIGRRGAQTQRFDTIAPWQFVKAVQTICNDSGGDWQSVLARPGVYDGIVEIVDRYDQQKKKMNLTDKWHPSFRAAIAWRAAKYAEAKKSLDEAGDKVEYSAFVEVGSKDPPAAIGHAYAMAGPQAKTVEQAETAFRTDHYEEALKLYKSIAAAPDLNPHSKPYLETRIQTAERRFKFANGEWVDVQPNASLRGWIVYTGAWRIDENGWLQGNAGGGKYTGTLVLDESVGTRVELSGVMSPSGPDGANPGVLIGKGTQPMFYAGIGQGMVFVFSGNGFKQRIPAEGLKGINGPARFVMTYDNAKLSLTINEKLVLDKYQVPLDSIGDTHVGVYSSTQGVCLYRDLKIRRLPGGAPAPIQPDAGPHEQ